jgi:hypothetical protein
MLDKDQALSYSLSPHKPTADYGRRELNRLTVSSTYYGSNPVNDKSHAFVIIEVNTTEADEQAYVESMLGCNVKPLVGCYCNNINPSYLVPLPHDSVDCFHLMEKVEKLCLAHRQESMLVVNSARKASLVYFDQAGHVENLGVFQKSSPAEALKLGNWSADGSQFWIVK